MAQLPSYFQRIALSGTLLAFALALGVVSASAQTPTTGAISGIVTDASGAGVPGATVQATSVQNGTVYTSQSKANGSYLIPLLHPGGYQITVTRTGFNTAKQGPVDVAVAGTLGLNFKLAVGQSTQTVEVTGQAPLIEPENPNISATLDTKAITNLPNPGNDLTFLAQVAPGAVINKGASSPSYIGATYDGLNATGVNYTIDGASYNDPFLGINESGPTNLSLGQNDIQEVTVNTNAYSVSQGRSEAGQINYVSKHGTNQYHGNLDYQWNGRVLNAYDTFVESVPVTPTSPLPSKPFDNVNNYAGSIGGRILNNKLFFFVDDEGARIDLPEVITGVLQPTPAYVTYAGQQLAVGGCETNLAYFVPSAGAATGNCAASAATQPAVGNGNYLYLPPETGPNAAGGVDESAFQKNELGLYKNIAGGNGLQLAPVAESGCNLDAKYVSSSNPLGVDPNFNPQLAAGQKKGDANLLPDDTGCTTSGTFTGTNLTWENKLVTRVDWDPNQANTIWVSYMNDRGLQATGLSAINPVFNEDSFQPEWSSTADWTRVLSVNAVNDLTLTAGWYRAPFVYANEAAEQAASPVAMTTPWSRLGSNSTPQGRDVTNWAIIDNLDWTTGAHQFIFGANFNRELVTDYDFEGAGLTPSVSAASFAEFDYGVATSGSLAFPKSTDQPVRIVSVDLFAGDTWQLSRKLTFIYGLRTTSNSNPYDPQGVLGNPTDFEDMVHSTTISPATVIAPSSYLWNSVPLVQWQPRVAFSYQPMANTLIRGGYGLFAQTPLADTIDNMARNEPFDPTFTAGYGQGNQGAIPPNQGANGCGFAINSGSALCGDLFDPSVSGNVVAAAQAANQAFQTAFAKGALSCAAFSTPQPSGTCIPVNGVTIQPQQGLNAPYAEEWSFGIERQLGRNTALNLNYVGNRGLHNNYSVDPNAYQTLCSGCFSPIPYSATGSAGSPDPRFSSITQERYDGYSTYNALQAGYNIRNVHGFTLGLNYAWAHGLSTNTPYNDVTPLSYTYRDTTGLPFHTFSANYIYALPWHTGNHLLGEIVNGWQISGATFAQSGDPIFITGASVSSRVFQASGPTTTAYFVSGVSPYSKDVPITTATLAGGQTYSNAAGVYQWLNPNAFFSAFDSQTHKCVDPSTQADAAANTAAVCQFPATEANALLGPGFEWTNFFLTKTFQVSEGVQFRFDAQAYNLFNHPNYAQPNTTAPTPGQPSTYVNDGTISSLAHPADGLLGNGLGGDNAPRMIAFQGTIVF